MKNRIKEIKSPEPRRDIQAIMKTFELEMRMISKIPKSYYSKLGGVAAKK